MSAIASFFRMPVTALEGLRQARPGDGYFEYMRQNGTEVADYNWSGYVLATLFSCLIDEYGIDLMSSPHQDLADFLVRELRSSVVILTVEHRDRFAERLSPDLFDRDRLRDFYNKFNETDEPDAGDPMMDGIVSLSRCLHALDQQSVVVLTIG